MSTFAVRSECQAQASDKGLGEQARSVCRIREGRKPSEDSARVGEQTAKP